MVSPSRRNASSRSPFQAPTPPATSLGEGYCSVRKTRPGRGRRTEGCGGAGVPLTRTMQRRVSVSFMRAAR